MIQTKCPSCERSYEVADYLAGFTIICKSCRVTIPVPKVNDASVPAASGGQTQNSALAERLAFIKNEYPEQPAPAAAPLPAPANMKRGGRPFALRGGAILVLLGAVGVTTFFLLRDRFKEPEAEVLVAEPREVEAVPIEVDSTPPVEPPPSATTAKEEPETKPAPVPQSAERVYQRLLKSTGWVFARADLNGSEWLGEEDRPGKPAIRLRFVSPTVVVLNPAKGTILGNWSVEGPRVELRFRNGNTYSGTVAGTTMAGIAGDGGQSWNWKVQRGGNGVGSGVVVDSKHRLLLTNVHVVGDTPSVLLYFPAFTNEELLARREDYRKAEAITGKVVFKEQRCDLALVQLDRLPEGVEPVPLADKSARPAQPVHSVGNPGASGALWIYSRGQVRQVYQSKWKSLDAQGAPSGEYDSMILETDSPINPGDSGGPLVNDEGSLVGIAHAFHVTAKNLSVFIDVRECRTLLQKYYKSIGEAPEAVTP